MNGTVDTNKEVQKKNSLAWDTWKRLLKNKGAMFGLVFMVGLVLMAIFADFLYDYDTQVIAQNIQDRLIHPCMAHPFGTDEFGRDLLARIVHGSRMSLVVSFTSVAISLAVGGVLGAISGYFGGMIDDIIMRITDILLAIPMTLFAIVIVAALGPNTQNLALALAASSIPIFARLVRGSVITVRDVEYVEAARAIGANHFTIITKHILPNCMAPIIVQVTLRIATAIYNTAALSFLGMGVQAPAPEWGGLLAAGRSLIRDHSYLSVIPGLAIMLTVLALNLLGDGLRDALDPRLK
ncbi:MAG: ABC transporter permease [Lachnospiraceae bacterium]|nr:ABC transporter permease [Lachnospiraceae bacterium]MDD7024495.1 ABC transporter permease [Oscillospiraceae bacterium]MDY5540988.1 ABC transporter permease [Lachnospiraceae bacterium]MDY5648237.1 ABC transporter permease [Lachnospiraceae bacterium]